MRADSGSSGGTEARVVRLRDEVHGRDRRALWAYLDPQGNLRIEGQDLGPATAMVSDDGEYEWIQTVKKADLPRLASLLGATEDDDLLDVLGRRWTGLRSYDLEMLLRDSDIDVDLFVWS